MIYDLATLGQDITIENVNKPGVKMLVDQKLQFAIAERLEALVDAQKPRWVEFEYYDGSGKTNLLVSRIWKVYETHSEFDRGIVICCNGNFYNVKGTLPEVLAKLRGDA